MNSVWQRLTGKISGDVSKNHIAHFLAGFMGCAGDVRLQDHVVERNQLGGNPRFILKDVESGPGDNTVL
ncbi:Uncharacterised protein [Raoultella terrigena]|uniref:Uncharacterized protein n=1 Tax=Raoultella terrigena TaxID=577 RepID=A0A7Z9CUE9_RAOTE|nr:Uncharacterised protein [Raoultella terrigena]